MATIRKVTTFTETTLPKAALSVLAIDKDYLTPRQIPIDDAVRKCKGCYPEGTSINDMTAQGMYPVYTSIHTDFPPGCGNGMLEVTRIDNSAILQRITCWAKPIICSRFVSTREGAGDWRIVAQSALSTDSYTPVQVESDKLAYYAQMPKKKLAELTAPGCYWVLTQFASDIPAGFANCFLEVFKLTASERMQRITDQTNGNTAVRFMNLQTGGIGNWRISNSDSQAAPASDSVGGG